MQMNANEREQINMTVNEWSKSEGAQTNYNEYTRPRLAYRKLNKCRMPALDERMFALVGCGRYLGVPEGVPAQIVAPTCGDEPR